MSRSRLSLRAISAGLCATLLSTVLGAGFAGASLGSAANAATSCTLSSLSGAPNSHPFYIGAEQDANYVGWKVTATANIADAWAKVSNFSGNIQLSTHQPAAIRLGALANAGSAPAYFQLMATGASANPAGYTITIFNGNPASGGSSVCTANDGFTSVASTIAANANKVTSITLSNTVPPAGGTFKITVEGASGTIGTGDTGTSVGWFNPSVASSWPANALQMTGMSIKFGTTTYTNRLVLTAADAAYKTGGNYTAVYDFVVKSSLATSAEIRPLAYIASGTQEKYTGSYPTPLPLITPPGTPSVYLTKSASVNQTTGVTTFTISVKNADPSTAYTLDDIVDTPSLPTANFKAGTATFNGSAIANPTAAAGKLTFVGPFAVPANTTRLLTYQMQATLGTGSNSVIGHIGATTIGKAVNSSSPATSNFTYGYRVTYFPSGGGGTTPTDATYYPSGSIVTVQSGAGLTPPTGCQTFAGWAPSPGGNAVYTPPASFAINADTSLYAVWNSCYPVAYDPNGGSGTITYKTEVDGSDAIPQAPAAPTRDGYTFLGWSTNQNAGVGDNSVTVTGPMTLYAVWATQGFLVTYDPNGGSGLPVVQTESFNSDAIAQAPAAPTRTGYTFLGWSTFSGADAPDDSVIVTGAMTLYAVWQLNSYVVTYHPNGGSGVPVNKNEDYNSDAIAQAPTAPTRTHYTFLGWSSNQLAVAPENTYTVTGAVTLYAVWSPVPYRVTYYPAGGSGSVPTDATNYTFGDTVTTKSPTSLNPPTQCQEFIGWATSPLGSAAYVPPATFTITGNTSLYAVWTSCFPVAYHPNGGSGSVVYQTEEQGSDAIQQAPAAPTRSGYTFTGWSTNPAATNGDASAIVTGPMTLYAAWQLNSFVITYHPNGGSGVPVSKSEIYGSDAIMQAPVAPTREGYTFLGWSTNQAATSGDVVSIVTGPTTLYAVWQLNTYRVTYHPNGGDGPAFSKYEDYGSDALTQAPMTPTRTGYTFLGWSTNPTASTPDIVDIVTGPLTLYAVWQANTFAVTYHPNGGSGSPVTKLELYGSDAIPQAPTSPVREGYTFAGWSTNPSSNIGDVSDIVTGPLTLYAVWLLNSYRVTYHPNGGSGAPVSKNEDYGTDAITQAPAAPTRTGYTFVGWSLSATATVGDVADIVTGPMTLYAIWQINSFTVTYHPNGGTGAPTSKLENYGSDAISQAPIAPTRTGYTFLGWSPDSQATVGIGNLTVTAPTTVYAVWQINNYRVIYHPNGGSGAPVSKYEDYGTDAIAQAPTAPTRTGYTFAGWSLNSSATAGDVADIVTGPMTLYAVWIPVPYSITYNGSGGGGTVPVDPNSYISGSSATTLPGTSLIAPSGCQTFLGWATSLGGPVAYVPPAQVTITGSITLYAVWSNCFIVAYHPNGGSGAIVYKTEAQGSDAIAQAPNAPTRTGYTFQGWALNPSAAVPDGVATVIGPMTLYAIWHLNTYRVTYHPNGGSGPITTKYENFNSDAIVQAPSAPTRTGYTFLGWALNSSASTPDAFATVTSDMTLYAVWQINNYRVTYHPNGGSGVPVNKYEDYGTDAIAQAPTTPTRTGYTFLGWSTNPSANSGDALATVTGPMTLYAVWQLQTFPVTYDPNGGSGAPVIKTEAYNSEAISQAPNAPSRSGFIFLGWSTNPAAALPDVSVIVTEPLTVYAVWQANTVVVTYHPNGGSGSPANKTVTKGSEVISQAPVAPTRDGFIFRGWSTNPAATTGDTTVIANSALTVYAVWTPITYAITYNTSGGGTAPVDPNTYPNGGSAPTLPGSTLTPPNGCQTFLGWATTPNGAVAFVPPSAVTVTGATTLYAVWSNCFVVAYDPNGGSGSTTYKTEAQGSDAISQAPTAPTRNGYTFLGWSLNPSASVGEGSVTVNGAITVYAVWQLNNFRVTYHPNGGIGVSVSKFEAFNSDAVTQAPITPVRDGYTFIGWSLNASANAADASIAVTGAITVYAVWRLNTYVVTYDANGGPGGIVTKSENHNSDAIVQAPATSPRPGYALLGWSTNPNATTPDLSVVVTGPVTLYAVWQSTSVPVTYSPNGGNGAPVTKSELKGSDALAQAPADPTRSNYTFLGWSTNPSATVPDAAATVNGAMTLYAVWQVDTFLVTYHPNGGFGPTSSKYEAYNSDAVSQAPSAPSRTGYTFRGWSSNPNATQGDQSAVVTGAMTMYAVWTQITYTITYNTGGSNPVPVDPTNYPQGSNAPVQPGNGLTPPSGCQTFAGWATTPNGAVVYVPPTTVPVTSALTLYAVWNNCLSVAYDPNGGSGSVTYKSEALGSDAIGQAPLSPSRSGYTFLGWSTNSNSGSGLPSYTVTSAVTLYAVWTPVTHAVNYYTSPSQPPIDSKSYPQGSTVSILSGSNLTPPSGCQTFAGWATSPNGAVMFTAPGSTTVSGALNLYAVWNACFMVTYDPNGGSGSTTSKHEALNSDAIPQAPATPTRANYTFLGWSTNAAALSPLSSLPVSGTTTLYAVWKVNTYMVIFNQNGGTNPPAPRNVPANAPITLPDGPTPPSGCQFLGWATTSGATVPEFGAGSPYTASANIALFAVYGNCTPKPMTKVTVVQVGSGSTNSRGEVLTTGSATINRTLTPGSKYSVTAVAPQGSVVVWGGACKGITAQTCWVVVNEPTQIEVRFAPAATVFPVFYYDTDRWISRLSTSDRAELVKTLRALDAAGTRRLVVTGHADIRNTPTYNLWLAGKRAESARAYILDLAANLGLGTFTITTRSSGETDKYGTLPNNRRSTVSLYN